MSKFERKAKDNGENSPTVALIRAQQIIARSFIRQAHLYGHDFRRYLRSTRDIFKAGEPITPTTGIKDALKPPPPAVQLDDLAGMNLEVLNKWRDRFHKQIAFDVIERERVVSTYFTKDDLEAWNRSFEVKKAEIVPKDKTQEALQKKREELIANEQSIASPIQPSYERNPRLLQGFDLYKLVALRNKVGRYISYDATEVVSNRPIGAYFEPSEPQSIPPPEVMVKPKQESFPHQERQYIQDMAKSIDVAIRSIIAEGRFSTRPESGNRFGLANIVDGANDYSNALLFARQMGIAMGHTRSRQDILAHLIFEAPFDTVTDLGEDKSPFFTNADRALRIHLLNSLFAIKLGFLRPEELLNASIPRFEHSPNRIKLPHLEENSPYRLEWDLQLVEGNDLLAARSLIFLNKPV